MSAISIILIIMSAFLHAGWNLVLKKENNHTISFVLQFSFFTALCAIPILIIFREYIHLVPISVLLLSIISGLFLPIYYVALSKAYKYGDISFAYPIVRSIPIIMVAILSSIFMLGKPLSNLSIVGMTVIIIGCFILPMKHLRDIKLKNYTNITCLFCFTAALATAGYTIIDDISINIINSVIDKGNTLIKLTAIYASLEFIFGFLWILLFTLLPRKNILGWNDLFNFKKSAVRSAAIIGIGTFAAYFLVLLAMSFVTNISYVVSFRQLSIPLGAVLGIIIFKERCNLFKILGIFILLIGLITVAIF